MNTLVTRKGRTGLHQLRRRWKEQDVMVGMTTVVHDERDPAEVAREDADIATRRAAFPLH